MDDSPVSRIQTACEWPEFDQQVEDNGYRWWYLDAVSDDRRHAITIIVFIGSVFSPYYSWARSRQPARAENHCAVNVALYGRGGKRWAMTERGAGALQRGRDAIRIGPSGMRWSGDSVIVDIDEIGVPLPARIRGQVRVYPETASGRQFALDSGGRHCWQPIFPDARIEVSLARPALTWRGHAYLDSNHGAAPLEDDFHGWDWSRVSTARGRSTIVYDRRTITDGRQCLALRCERGGALREITPPEATPLPATAIWRIARETRAEPAARSALHVQTVEDTPFYSRSLLTTTDDGEDARGVHESLSLGRFKRAWVRMLLPFRMPRVG